MTDIKPYHDQIVVDDITNPNLNIYRGCIVDLLNTSSRGTSEPHKRWLQNLVGADLIIKPLSTEFIKSG